MRTTALSLLVPFLFVLAACSGQAAPQEPPASPTPPTAASAPAEPDTPSAAAEGEPSSPPAPSAEAAPASRCGVGGIARSRATTCDFVLVKGGAECCFTKMEDACREAGCPVTACDLLKSMPPQVQCRN